jgi:S-adenosylmethionine synthetase
MRSNYLFTSESVSEGHPDKVADQISDAVVDLFLSKDPEARVACETMTTTNRVVVAGEIRCKPVYDEERWPEHGGWAPGARDEIEEAVRGVVKKIGYEQAGFHWANFEFSNHLHGQSPHIAQGVDAGENKEEAGPDARDARLQPQDPDGDGHRPPRGPSSVPRARRQEPGHAAL